MKQVKFLAVVLGLIIAGTLSVNAQKIGSVNVEALVFNLPEAQNVQRSFQKWQEDSIGGTYTKLSQEYQEKDSLLKTTTNASVKSSIEKDLTQLGQQLTNWQQIAQQAMQQKQAQMFGPLQTKVIDAVNAYAKEKGYTYVLTREAFVVAPNSDDISIPVAQRLGIKVNNDGSAVPPAGGAGTTPPAGGGTTTPAPGGTGTAPK